MKKVVNKCELNNENTACFMCSSQRHDVKTTLLNNVEVELCSGCRKSLLRSLLLEEMSKDIDVNAVIEYKAQIEVLNLLMYSLYDDNSEFDKVFDIAIEIINQQDRLISELEKNLF